MMSPRTFRASAPRLVLAVAAASVCPWSAASAAPSFSDPQWTETRIYPVAWTTNNPNNVHITDLTNITGPYVHTVYDTGYQSSATSLSENANSSVSIPDSIPSPIAPEGYAIPVTWTGAGQSTGFGLAGPGALHAYAYAQAKLDPNSVSNVQTDSNGNTASTTATNPTVATASVDSQVSAKDTLTFQSATLGSSDVIHLLLTLKLDGTTHTFGTPANTTASILAQAYYARGYNYSTPISLQAPGTIQQDIYLTLGSTISLFSSLEAQADAGTGDGSYAAKEPLTTALADAGDTASIYLDPAPGSDFTIVSATGHNYSTPVPEPASLLATSAALPLLFRRRRNR